MLVIDDVGLLPLRSTAEAAWFFEVVNTRYNKGLPTLVTTNRGLPEWGRVFGDTVVAAAILDRLMHNAVVFNIRGPRLAPTRARRPADRRHRTHPTTNPLTSPTPTSSPHRDANSGERQSRLLLSANNVGGHLVHLL